jgi:hypothetical protein
MPAVQQTTEEAARTPNMVEEETRGISDSIRKLQNILTFRANANAGPVNHPNTASSKENIGRNVKPPTTSSICGSHNQKPLKRINGQKSKSSITEE